MATSSRFAVAVHALIQLAAFNGRPVTSEAIARSASTNASVIRRILSMMNDAGLTRARLGQGGGALLARPADEITLLDVYRAVEREHLFALHRSEPNQDCPIGQQIVPALTKLLERATGAMEHELDEVTIAELADVILTRPCGDPALH